MSYLGNLKYGYMRKYIFRIYYKLGFSMRQYFRGYFMLNRLIKEKTSDEIYVLLTENIGDDVYGMAYVKSLKEKYSVKVSIFCREDRRRLIESFVGSYDVIIGFNKKSKEWTQIRSISNSRGLINKARKHRIMSVFPFHYIPLNLNDGRTELDYIRTDMLHLDDNASIQYPSLTDEPIHSIRGFEEIRDKVVVINPYSLSMNSDMLHFFNRISLSLVSMGYKVFTNVVGNQKALAGSEPLNCSIYEFYAICNQIPLVISVRSGLIDMSISAKSNFFVYYFPFADNAFMYSKMSIFYKRHTLKAWKTDNVEEHLYRDDEEAYKALMKFMNKSELKIES